jgi:hypothetical protein
MVNAYDGQTNSNPTKSPINPRWRKEMKKISQKKQGKMDEVQFIFNIRETNIKQVKGKSHMYEWM